MNVLSPELMWIGQRCYRVNIPNDNRKNEEKIRVNYEEQDFDCQLEISNEDFYEIETVDNGRKFQLKVHVPQMFHSQVIGAKGNTKRRIEQETGTSIQVPKIGVKDTNIVIKGNNKKDVVSAKNRLDLIMIAGRAKQQFTHFLSVSFATDEIKQNFLKFKSEILNDSESHGLHESLFQKPEKLHLTVVMLVLLDNQDRSVAAECLHDCKEMIVDDVLQNGTLKVSLAGLDIMNDDPSSVDVLYAKVVSEELQTIANEVAHYFASRGFIQLQYENIKLHVTLINSRFSDNDDAIEKEENQDLRDSNRNQRKTFNATKILKKFKDYNFGSVQINQIHLSQRYSKASNGYYESTEVIKF